jgi:hypothetical protein
MGDSTAKNSAYGQKIALTAIVDQTNNLPLARTKPAVVPVLSDSLLDADVPEDDSVFGADANGDEDIYHNGSSVFSGNAVSAEVADLAAGLRAHVLARVASAALGRVVINAQCSTPFAERATSAVQKMNVVV